MALDPVKNFAKVSVSTGYDDAATSIVLATGDGAELPDPSTDGDFNLVWWNWTDYKDPADDPNVEIVRVTARSTDTLTITRAQESTSASAKNTAGKTYKMLLGITKKMIEDIEGSSASGFSFVSVTGRDSNGLTTNVTADSVPFVITRVGGQVSTIAGGGITITVNRDASGKVTSISEL